MPKELQIAMYCRCGAHLELPSGRVFLYDNDKILAMFKKHMKPGCDMVSKETMLAELKKRKRNGRFQVARMDAGGKP